MSGALHRGLLKSPLIWSALHAWRELLWISTGQLVGALGAIVGLRLMTAVLDPAGYGELALALTTGALAFQLVMGPLVNAYERYFASAREDHRTDEFVGAVRRLSTAASTLIVCTGVLAGVALALSGNARWIPLASSAVIFAVLSGWESVLDGVQNAARLRSAVALHQAVRFWLRPILAVVLLNTVAATSAVGLAGYALASLVVLCSQFWFFRRMLRSIHSTPSSAPNRPKLDNQIASYARPFALWGLFTWMQMSSDRWALDAFRSSSEVGIYSVVYQLGAYPITLIGTALTQLAVPIVFAQAGEGKDQQRTSNAIETCVLLAVAVLGVTILLAAVGVFMHQPLFAVLVGPQYRTASFLFPLAVLSAGLFLAGQMLSLVPMVLGRSQALLAPKVWTALLAVVLNVCGAYWFGPAGVLWAGLAFAICYCVWVGLSARNMVRTLDYNRRQFSQTNA